MFVVGYVRLVYSLGMFVVGYARLVVDVLLMCSAIWALIILVPSSVTWNPSGLMIICFGILSNSACVSIMSILSVFISGSVVFNMLFCIISRMFTGCARGGVCTMSILFWFIVVILFVMFLILSSVSVAFSPLRV